MEKTKKIADAYLEIFIKEVAQKEVVWGLYCEQGWANVDSHEFEDTIVFPFWSNKELAAACAIEEWTIYQPAPLDLPEFLENWCVGMYRDHIMPGINWDADLFGKEIEPLSLIFKILNELNQNKKEIKFKMYNSQHEFEDMIKMVSSGK